jgi:hypothetical protein
MSEWRHGCRWPAAIAGILFVAIFPGTGFAQGGGGGTSADNVAPTVVQLEEPAFTVISGRVDHVAAGTGLRNFASGTIEIRGVRPNSTIQKAFLYFAEICKGTTCPANVKLDFQGSSVTLARFCTGPQPCWSGSLLGGYRADVTSLMPPAGQNLNRDYTVSGAPGAAGQKDGRDPWDPATNSLPKSEGATLVVVYSNPALPASGRVYIHNGCSGNTAPATVNIINTLSPAAPNPLLFARFTRFGADGQVGASTFHSQDFTNEKTFFKGPVGGNCPGGIPQIAGDGALLDRDSDWNGSDGGPLNQLWDTHSTIVHNAGFLEGLLAPGAGNYCVKYVIQPVTPGAAVDCMNFIGFVLGVF